ARWLTCRRSCVADGACGSDQWDLMGSALRHPVLSLAFRLWAVGTSLPLEGGTPTKTERAKSGVREASPIWQMRSYNFGNPLSSPSPHLPGDGTPSLWPSRRQLLKPLAGLGGGTAVFQRAVVAQTPKEGAIPEEMVKQAEWISGIKPAEADRKAVVNQIDTH